MTDLLTWFQTNRPKSQVFVGTVPPRGPDKDGHEQYNVAVTAFNTWLTQEVPTLSDHFHLVDLYALFVDGSGQVKGSDSSDGIFLKDGIHPSHNGYVAMGDAWFKAIGPLHKLDPTTVSTLLANSASTSTAVNKLPTLNGEPKIICPQDAVQGVKWTVKGGPTTVTAAGDYGGNGATKVTVTPSMAIPPPSTSVMRETEPKIRVSIPACSSRPKWVRALSPEFNSIPAMTCQVAIRSRSYWKARMTRLHPVRAARILPSSTKVNRDLMPIRIAGTPVCRTILNDAAYKTYRLLITKTRATTDATQYGEVILIGKPAP